MNYGNVIDQLGGAAFHMIMSPFNRPDVRDFRIEGAEEWRHKNDTVDRLLRYFEEKTGGTRLPMRQDFNPMDFGDLLPGISIFEPQYNDNGELRDLLVVLLGSKLDEFYGAMTGQMVSELAHPEVRARIHKAGEVCIKERAPIVVRSETLSTEKEYLAITVLYVPMSTDGGRIDRILAHNQIESHYSGL